MAKDDKLSTYGPREVWSEFEIVASHPLADQSELLEKLGLDPSACVVCDLWWKLANQLVLVSVAADGSCKTTFTFKDIDSGPRFYVRVDRTELRISDINAILRYLSAWVLQNKVRFESTCERVILVDDTDILRTEEE